MAKKISVRLYLDGAAQFNSDIRKVDNGLKELNSEMKRNSETFKDSQNSIEALRAKSETLNKQYEKAEEKVKLYSKRLEEVAKAHETATNDYNEYNSALQKEKEKLEEIEKSVGKNTDEYKAQAEVVKELERETSQASNVIETLDAKEVQLQTSLNNATAEQVKYGRELTQTNAYLKEAEKSTDGCAKSIDQYGRNVSKADEETQKISKSLEKFAQNEALEKLGEGAKKLLENLMECAEAAETFEYSIAKVQSIARVSEEDLGEMSDEIRRVSTEMGYSANEVSEAVYQAISASVDAADAVGFVDDATKLARAGFTETVTAVDVLTTAINAYGKEANTTRHIADDLITTQNLGKTTVDELAQSMGQVIPTASALGVSLDQLSSMYVIMTKQGINTANATTYIRAMMNELSDSGSDLAETLYAVSGYSFGELMSQGKSVGDVLQMLGDSVEGDSEEFKNLFSNVRAGLGALSIFNSGAEAFNDTLRKMGENAGATDEAFATMADTAVMTNARFEASVENLKIAVGESLSPAIDELKEKGISVLEWFSKIAEENPQLVQALAGAAAGIATLTVVATAAAGAMALLRLAFGDVSAVSVLAIAGVAGAAGAIGTLAITSEDAADKIVKTVDALRKTNDATNETAQSSQANIEHLRTLAERYDELADCADLTDAEFEELNNIITELNTSVPGLSLAYRETKNVVEDGTVALKENIDAMIDQLKYQNDIEELKNLYTQQAEAEKAVAEASEELSAAQKDLDEAEQLLKEGVSEASNQYDNARLKVIELSEAQKEAEEIQTDVNDRINELTGSVTDYTKKTQEATEAEEEAAKSKQAEKDAQDQLEKSISAASEAIGKQIGLFDEWDQKSELTLSKMQDNWKGQTKGVNQYKDDLKYLKNVIDSDTDPAIKDLAQNMVNMGIDGSAEIHNFVDGLKEIGDNKEKIAELAQTWQDHIDAISEAEGIYAKIQYEETDYVDKSTKLFTQFYSDSESGQKDHNKTMVTLTEDGVKDQTKAIKQEMPKMETASRNLAENTLKAAEETFGMQGGKSTIFYDMGASISESMAEGMTNGTDTVAEAMKSLCEAAVNAIDLSKVAENLSNKVSQAVKSAEDGLEKTVSSANRKARMESGG